jgi:hypothetical protein
VIRWSLWKSSAREWLIQLDTAATPSSVEPADLEHRSARLTHVVDVDLPLREVLIDVAYPLFDPRVTSVRLARHG